MTQIEHVRQHYTIASAYCAQWVSLPSAELELMIRVSPRPRIFGGEPSASVRGSQEFLQICVRRWMHPPSAHLCRRPPWPTAWRPRWVARQHDGHLMPPPHLPPHTRNTRSQRPHNTRPTHALATASRRDDQFGTSKDTASDRCDTELKLPRPSVWGISGGK